MHVGERPLNRTETCRQQLGVPPMHCRQVSQLAGASLLSKAVSAVHQHVKLHNNRHLNVCTGRGRAVMAQAGAVPGRASGAARLPPGVVQQ